MGAVALLSAMTANECSADSTTLQLQQQQLGVVDPEKRTDDDLAPAPPGQLNEILLKYDYLNQFFQLMDLPDAEDRLQRALKRLQGNPRTVGDATDLYKLLTDMSGKDNEFYGEARWRVLYLLGELGDPRVTSLFFDIASADMPNPERVGEVEYGVEFRLHARAIAGLEKLKAVELLVKLYEENELMRGLAAASLVELGRAPDGVTQVDGVKVLGYGDPTDYNAAKGSPGERIPSSRELAPTDDRQSIMPRWPTDR
jgi:hypothetical protein